tara:strand:- start:633 stop:824 length:192 start_codon:yes stop_codon:yes gene_type:complete
MTIHLVFVPEPHVVHTEIVEIMASKEKCEEKVQWIFDEADKRGMPVPPEINMGCVPLNKVKGA